MGRCSKGIAVFVQFCTSWGLIWPKVVTKAKAHRVDSWSRVVPASDKGHTFRAMRFFYAHPLVTQHMNENPAEQSAPKDGSSRACELVTVVTLPLESQELRELPQPQGARASQSQTRARSGARPGSRYRPKRACPQRACRRDERAALVQQTLKPLTAEQEASLPPPNVASASEHVHGCRPVDGNGALSLEEARQLEAVARAHGFSPQLLIRAGLSWAFADIDGNGTGPLRDSITDDLAGDQLRKEFAQLVAAKE